MRWGAIKKKIFGGGVVMMVSHNKGREGRLDCERIIHDAQVCRHAFSLRGGRSLQAHDT